MQTFLPYPDFKKSAESLDKKRCWKQVVEAQQIINVLEGRSVAWKNHPAVQMWEGSATHLKKYFNVFLKVCKEKHNINTKYVPYIINPNTIEQRPFWWGDEDFHRAMRARLIEKDEAFYYSQWPDDEWFNGAEYLWPVMDGSKTFRTITR